MENNSTSKKEISFFWAVVPFLFMIISMLFTVVILEQAPHIPLMIGTAIAAIVAYYHGYSWQDIEEMMYKGIRLALPAIVIIILVGLIIGAWIGGGVVATMIYYGLKLITPSLFLVTIAVICAIVSLAIGSSWSTMATVGVAGMGIGLSMDIPAGMIAGAIISGSYFGDKMSPLSDTTNLAAGLTGTDLFDHIKHMFYTISMTIVAMTFGGILEYSGMLKSIISKILKIAKGTGGLIASVIISCIGTNASCSEQYISIVIPSRMYINTFLERRLHPKNLSRALEDGGTVTSVFFLWNTCGVFIAQTLNVNVLDYSIYAIFNYTVPIISVIFGYVGFKIIKINEEEYKEFKKQAA